MACTPLRRNASLMSYARWNGKTSDIYVYPTDTAIRCENCSYDTVHVEAFIAHIQGAHRDAGDLVPDGLEETLRAHFPTGIYDPERAYVPWLDVSLMRRAVAFYERLLAEGERLRLGVWPDDDVS